MKLNIYHCKKNFKNQLFSLYNYKKNLIIEEIKNRKNLCLTPYGWSGDNGNEFIVFISITLMKIFY